MLTFDEQQRIYDSVPTSYSVGWDGATYTYSDVPVWWDGQDHDIDLPEIVLAWNAQGVEKDGQQPMNQVLDYDLKPNVPDVDITRGTRVYDEMQVTFAVEHDQNADGVPAEVRSNAFAGVLLDHFRYAFDQNDDGPNDERPVLARVIGEPTVVPAEIDGDRGLRAAFPVRFHYTDRHVDTEPTVETVEGDVDVDGDSNTSNPFSTS